MSDITSLIRQTTADLLAVQNAMQQVNDEQSRSGAQEGGLAKIVNPELVMEFKGTIDRTRDFLWRHSEFGVPGQQKPRQQKEDAPAHGENSRLQLVSEFLWLLSRRAAPADSTGEETMSFFERIDSISDRLLAEHPENKSISKAA